MTAPPIPFTSGMSWLTKAIVVNHDTNVETEVGVVSATVTIDRKSDARRIVDCAITPDVDPALLTPPHRLKLFAGYRAQGADHWAPLAHVRMGVKSRGPQGVWQLRNCLSFESLVAAAQFRTPRQFDANTSMLYAMQTLISEAVPWATVLTRTAKSAPMPAGSTTFEKERWQAIAGREESMATALGVDVGCDGEGAFVIQDMPSGAATWDLSEGGLLVDYGETLDPSGVVNVWIASSDHPDTLPVRGVAEDTDSFSPTRVSRWGESVGFYSSPLLTSNDMCLSAAWTRLGNTRGISVSLDMTSVPNPWADITDVVSSTRSGVTTLHQLDKVTHSLDPKDGMQVTAAARTVSVNA